MSDEILFIGGGNMGRALLGGLIADGVAPERLAVADPDPARRQALARDFGMPTAARGEDLVGNAAVLVLAVKPQVLKRVARELAPHFGTRRPLVVSIVAGIPEADIDAWLGGGFPVVRCMPNTPALVRQGITALHANARVDAAQRQQAQQILAAVGAVVWVAQEAQLDAVTAVSGSGPAYFFAVMEAMEQAGRTLGLDADMARRLTLQTALGAAVLATQSGDSPATLRAQVTSPGGTTEAALAVLQQGGLAALFEQALKAAQRRAGELADAAAKQA
ncbi:MAG: pyrroline-5-carboxylate reductase [Immundisolibacter sp.]